MFRAVWTLTVAALVCALGCGNRGEARRGGGAAAENEGDRPADVPSVFRDMRTHLDLLALAHLADVGHHGLYIDFGTPARMKYTIGQWRTGWGRDASEGDTTFTYVNSTTGRVYFHLDRPSALTLRFRIKPLGTRNMMVFLNNNALPSVRMEEGGGFRDYDVAVPAEHVVAGENYLLLRFGGVTRVGDEDVAVAVDSIRVIDGASDSAQAQSSFSPPVYGELSTEMRVGGVQRRALAVRAPTTLSWYIEVPPNGKLGFGVGAEGDPPTQGTAKAIVTPEGGSAQEIFSRSLTGRWQDQVVSLDRWVGQIVKLDLVVAGRSGAGRVGWSTPSVLVPPPPQASTLRPTKNVVVLLVDTLRADKLHAYNPRTRVRSPATDRFATEGVLFENAQAPENWTKPSVASVLTSLYPATHRAKTSEARLSQSATMVSEMYKEAGFSTSSFIANGYVSDRFGFDQGWDHYTNYIRENKTTLAHNVFQEAGDWIEQHKNERFFVYVQTIDPHVPYDPPADLLRLYDPEEYAGQVTPRMTPDLLERAKRVPPAVTFDANDRRRLEALYDGEVTYHDQQMGEFFERLRRLGVYDQTTIVITADHGEEFNDHGSWGHGHTVYQELLHVPLILRRPGIRGGQRIASTVTTLDIVPTVLEATGTTIPESVEGRSLMPYLRGQRPIGPAVAFSDFLDDRRVIRAGRWKLVLRSTAPTFFDLQADPAEQRELPLGRHPIALRYCRILLGQFLGARNRKSWLSADQNGPQNQLEQENADMDPTIRGQLRALGYAN